MKITKDELYEGILNGSITSFKYNGVRYYSEEETNEDNYGLQYAKREFIDLLKEKRLLMKKPNYKKLEEMYELQNKEIQYLIKLINQKDVNFGKKVIKFISENKIVKDVNQNYKTESKDLYNADGDEKPEETPERLQMLIENKDNFPMTDMIKLGYIRKLFYLEPELAKNYIIDLQKMKTQGRPNLQSAATNLLNEISNFNQLTEQ